MMKLKQMIKNELGKDKGLALKLAKKVGYKNATPLYKFVNEIDREIELNKLLIIIRELFPEREFELMNGYCRTLDPNKMTARTCLEYSVISKMENLHDYLINKLMNCSNNESKEWAEVYNIDKQVVEGSLEPLDAIEKLDKLKLKSNEMKAFSQIVKFYNYHTLRLIDTMSRLSPVIKKKIESVKNDYVADTYMTRLSLIMADISLHKGEIEYLRNLEKQQEGSQLQRGSIKSLIYLQIGNSYIFESYEKACKLMMKSKKIAALDKYEKGVIQAEQSLNFLSNYWCKKPNYLKPDSIETPHIHEVAFHKVRQGNSNGLKQLMKMDLSQLTDSQKGFHFFIRGLATNHEKDFYQSIKYFNLSGENFYKQAPLLELQKKGVCESLLEALSV